ncbi:hypothetical protein Hamer_G023157 [Homarus americanus]|uniref:Uncharacterized protein n=1 Tax=Homarus americanus TaxID=6706 RepID=A0A8J5MQI8_HOMAM|nr:hypothetical protein Hamer_G023157 [Homarus americanus]
MNMQYNEWKKPIFPTMFEWQLNQGATEESGVWMLLVELVEDDVRHQPYDEPQDKDTQKNEEHYHPWVHIFLWNKDMDHEDDSV